jgi:F0F1-type ATP synthase membrane subunit b/b'
MSAWVVVNFVLLVILLAVLGRKQLGKSFHEKHERMKRAVDEAEQLRSEVERMAADYRGKLDRLDTEIREILDEARADGEREKRLILERAERAAERIQVEALLAAEKEKHRRMTALERETLEAAARRAAELLRRDISEGDHRALTQELISKLRESDVRRP